MRLFVTIATALFFSAVQATSLDTVNTAQSDTTYANWFANHKFTGTNNGISIVPAFSLGRPALMYQGAFMQSSGKVRLEPEIRMSYDGEPWSTLLWARYILPKAGKWQFTAASHYALLFAPEENYINGVLTRSYSANRYLGFQATAGRPLTEKVNLSAFSLVAIGWFKGASPRPVQLHSVGLGLPSAKVGKFNVHVVPQVYYLDLAAEKGVFYAANWSISKASSHWAAEGMISQPFWKDEGLVVAPVVWNVGVSYNMQHKHQRIQVPTGL